MELCAEGSRGAAGKLGLGCVCVGGEVLGVGEESKKASWRRQWLSLQKRIQSNGGEVRKATAQAKTHKHTKRHTEQAKTVCMGTSRQGCLIQAKYASSWGGDDCQASLQGLRQHI